MPDLVKARVSEVASAHNGDLNYFMEWRPWLWGPAFCWLMQPELDQLAGKTVADFGCRYGRMSSLLALFGANVVGLDVNEDALEKARAETEKWGVADKVRLVKTDGSPEGLDIGPVDYFFIKSVLNVIGKPEPYIQRLAANLAPGGKIIAMENLPGPWWLHAIRKHVLHRDWKDFDEQFNPIDDAYMALLDRYFEIESTRDFRGLVRAMHLRKR